MPGWPVYGPPMVNLHGLTPAALHAHLVAAATDPASPFAGRAPATESHARSLLVRRLQGRGLGTQGGLAAAAAAAAAP